MGLWYLKDSGFELIAYSDADHAGCKDDYKSTSGVLQFLGEKLVSWSYKKQDCTMMFTAEAEYVVHKSSGCVHNYWTLDTSTIEYRWNDGIILLSEQNIDLRIYLLKLFPKNAL
ncbi:hypothetical protein Tco_0263087, partial [Tanacetum coccineum]